MASFVILYDNLAIKINDVLSLSLSLTECTNLHIYYILEGWTLKNYTEKEKNKYEW